MISNNIISGSLSKKRFSYQSETNMYRISGRELCATQPHVNESRGGLVGCGLVTQFEYVRMIRFIPDVDGFIFWF